MDNMTREERWFWVQTVLPLPDKGYFETSYDRFLNALPARPLGAEELARLAFYAGAAAAFYGLAEHDQRTEGWDEADIQADMAQLALEPLEYLKRFGIGVAK